MRIRKSFGEKFIVLQERFLSLDKLGGFGDLENLIYYMDR